MSEVPRRTVDEENIIRRLAYDLWNQAGQPIDMAREHWRRAEAMLQYNETISRRPIDTPFSITFTARNVPETIPSIAVKCLPDTEEEKIHRLPQIILVEAQSNPHLLPGREYLRPEYLAHDYRTMLVQIVAISAALDRIARLVDWAADQTPFPTAPFFEHATGVSYPFSPLKEEYRTALLRPDLYQNFVAEIDSSLSNHNFSNFVSFDVRCVSLGSDAGIEALLKAKTWKQAAWALVILIGTSIGAHYGTQAIDAAVPVVAPIARSFLEGVVNPRPAEYPQFRDNLQLHRDIENPGHPLPPPVILRG
jgi:hypothetical protein